MTIRERTGPKQRRLAGGAAVGALGAATALHGIWAIGSTWPSTHHDALADLVVGRRPFPGSGLCWAATGLLASATAVTATHADLLPLRCAGDSPPARRAATVLAGVLAIRGATGLVASGLGLGTATPQYRRWNLALYSPLCLGLAGLVVLAGPPHPSARPRRAR